MHDARWSLGIRSHLIWWREMISSVSEDGMEYGRSITEKISVISPPPLPLSSGCHLHLLHRGDQITTPLLPNLPRSLKHKLHISFTKAITFTFSHLSGVFKTGWLAGCITSRRTRCIFPICHNAFRDLESR